MVIETVRVVVCQVRSRHRSEEVRELIPSGYSGVTITNRGRNYDARELRDLKQQKCLAHIQHSLTEVFERQQREDRVFPGKLQYLFREAVELWRWSSQKWPE